jgi:hypothetical protein
MIRKTAPSGSGNDVYQLVNEDDKILSLIVNPASNTARVEYEGKKRVFLIRTEGFIRIKTVILNEYGVRICELPANIKGSLKDLARFFLQILQVKDPSQPLTTTQHPV